MGRFLGLVVAVAAALCFGCPVARAEGPVVEHVIIDGAGFDEFIRIAKGKVQVAGGRAAHR